jgi:glycosyltransferase involved in cell wall biosynthesis
MRIGIDANPMLGDRGGVGWHTYELVKAMIARREEVDLLLYVEPGSLRKGAPDLGDASPRARWVEAGKWLMRWRGARDRLDLYHGTNFKLRTAGRFGGVVTIHDLWLDRHPQYSTKLFGQQASFRRTKRTARRARKVITVSRASARDIEEFYGLPPDRIAVIPNGVSDEFHPLVEADGRSALCRQYAVPTGRFILFVGGADPRKNHEALVRAYAQRPDRLRDLSLVLVGDRAHRFGNMDETIRRHGVEGRAVCPGRLPIEELRRFYSYAEVFVFPSVYEGFGMPVLEAMACGAPVVTANGSSLPEVAGDAAVLVDPRDADALAQAIVRLIDNPAARNELREKGFRRAKQFTWDQAAQKTLALYRELCGSSDER